MSTPFRICACGKTASTEQELELFKKNHTCKHGRENICIVCHNKKTTSLYSSKFNNKRKIQNIPVTISGVAGVCRLCHKSTEVFDFHPDDSPSTLTFCNTCLSDAESRKSLLNEYILTFGNKISECEGNERESLLKTLAGRKQAYNFYFNNLK